MDEAMTMTPRERRVLRSRIVGDVYTAWIAERRAAGTLPDAIRGDVNGEENAELAFLTREAEDELASRTTEALRAAEL